MRTALTKHVPFAHVPQPVARTFGAGGSVVVRVIEILHGQAQAVVVDADLDVAGEGAELLGQAGIGDVRQRLELIEWTG